MTEGTLRLDHAELEALPHALRLRMLECATLREHRRGSIIASMRDAPALRIVSSGLVALLANDPDPRPIAIHGPARVVHPIAAAPSRARWTLTALATSNVYEIMWDAIEGLSSDPTFQAWRLACSDAERERGLDLLAAAGTPDAAERLVRLVTSIGSPLDGTGRFAWPLTQAQFALVAGLSRAHLNARLAALRETGRLRIEGGMARLRP